MVDTYHISENRSTPLEAFEKREVEEIAFNHCRLFPGLFSAESPLFISRAPGRLDIMGGIADYSGSVVCEGTLECATIAAVQKSEECQIHIVTKLNEESALRKEGSLSIGDLFYGRDHQLLTPQEAKQRFERLGLFSWSAYALGGIFFLLKAGILPTLKRGLNIGIMSNIPLGCGVSSSAALEVSTFMAILGALNLNDRLEPMEIARICQRIENELVGAPCGIMDQVTCILGVKDTLIKLQCQPHTFLGRLAVPEGCQFLGINSNVKHSVGGKRYKSARIGAFMGHKIITHKMQKDKNLGKYLCNMDPKTYKENFRSHLPLELQGTQFLKGFGHTIDPLSNKLLEQEEIYKIRLPTEHPILENERVNQFISFLEEACYKEKEREVLEKAGSLMYESHESYSKCCNLGALETDLVVDQIKKLGVEKGFYGAKITGGGSGGTVAVMCINDDETIEELKKVMNIYRRKTGLTPQLFQGSSNGALKMGIGVYTP
ncbi:MAG: hypothetical protein BAJALOKI1v1_400014 [Promethearchaeota archaeon]|nr:MAG: hypothetical protein BAJALOKI1v1_400014 [Candidatus Lokiarchaeota archaeon]